MKVVRESNKNTAIEDYVTRRILFDEEDRNSTEDKIERIANAIGRLTKILHVSGLITDKGALYIPDGIDALAHENVRIEDE